MTIHLRNLVPTVWLVIGLLTWLHPVAAQPSLGISASSNGTAGPISLTLTGAPGKHYLLQSADRIPERPAQFTEEVWSVLPANTREMLLPPNQWLPQVLRFVDPTNGAPPAVVNPVAPSRFFRALEFTGAVERVTFLRRELPQTPWQAFNLSWVFTNDAPGLEQVIRLRAPGPGSTSANQLAGSAPPSGAVYHISNLGTWTTNETAPTNRGFGGILTKGLPETTAGRWQLEFLLHNVGSGSLVDFAAIPFLASGSPAIYLNLNRPIAGTNDPIIASVDLTGGSFPQTIQLLTWLVRPDGTELSLPTFTPGLIPFYQGLSTNSQFSLFQQPFTDEGEYRVEARLIDSLGNVIGLARRAFNICSRPDISVTGMVYGADGSPLGANAALARVRAFHLLDNGDKTVATIGTNGSFSISLPPGHYDFSAVVHDVTGLHETTNATLLRLECDATNLSLSITTAPAAGPPASLLALSMPASIPKKGTDPVRTQLRLGSDGLPAPTVWVTVKNDSREPLTRMRRELVTAFVDDLAQLNPSITFYDEQAIREQVSGLAAPQSAGTDTAEDANRMADLARIINTDFILGVTFYEEFSGPFGNVGARAHANVADVCHFARVWGDSLELPFGMGFNYPDMASLAQLSTTGFGGFAGLRARQCRPVQPYVGLALNALISPPAGTLTATATLRDGGATGPVQASLPVQFYIRRPDGSEQTINYSTDANGQAVHSFNVGTMAQPPGFVTARFLRNGQTQGESSTINFRVQDNTNAAFSLVSTQAAVHAGAQAPITVTLSPVGGGGPVTTGVNVSLTATNGTIASSGAGQTNGVLHVITTPGSGGESTASIVLTGGSQAGVATVAATCIVTNIVGNATNTQTLNASIVLAVNTGFQMLTFASPPETLAGFFSRVIVETAVDGAHMPGLPVTYSLDGDGTLTNGVDFTDAAGRAEILFLAPTNAPGTSVISAVLVYDNQNYTNTATVTWQPIPVCDGITNENYCLQVITTNSVPASDTFGLVLNDLGDVLYREPGGYKLWKRGVVYPVPEGTLLLNNRGDMAGGNWVLRNGVTNQLPQSPLHLDDEGWVYYVGLQPNGQNNGFPLLATRDGVTVRVLERSAELHLFAGRSGALLSRRYGTTVYTTEIQYECEHPRWPTIPNLCGPGWDGNINIVSGSFDSEEIFSIVSRDGSQRRLFANPTPSADPTHLLPAFLPTDICNSGEMLGLYEYAQPNVFPHWPVIGRYPGSYSFLPSFSFHFGQLNSHGECVYQANVEEVRYTVFHRKDGVFRELKDEIPGIPGWHEPSNPSFRTAALRLNENGQILIQALKLIPGGSPQYALWLMTPLHH